MPPEHGSSDTASDAASRHNLSRDLSLLYRLALDMGSATTYEDLVRVVLDGLLEAIPSEVGAVLTVIIAIVTLWAVPLTRSGMSKGRPSALRSMPSLMQPYHGVKPFPDRHAGSSRRITRGFPHFGTETSEIPVCTKNLIRIDG